MDESLSREKSVLIKGWIGLCCASLLEAIQVIMIIALILSRHPLAAPTEAFMPEWWDHLFPEREMWLYRLFIVCGIVFQALAVLLFGRRLAVPSFQEQLGAYTLINVLVVVIASSLTFKMFLFGTSTSGQIFLAVTLAVSLLIKLGWRYAYPLVSKIENFRVAAANGRRLVMWNDMLVPGVVFMLIYPPNLLAILIETYRYDFFLHLDGFVMAPAWAALKGCKLNLDVISQYGVGMPLLVGKLAQAVGGFGYQTVVSIFVWLVLVYFVLFYFFIKQWLGSRAVAWFGLFLGLKAQMFHWGVKDPFIWRYLSPTVARYFTDIILFFLVLLHLRQGKRRVLFLIAGCLGFSLFYVSDSGAYQLIAFYFYLASRFVFDFANIRNRGWKLELLVTLSVAVIPFFVALMLFGIAQGASIFSTTYWANQTELISLFNAGFGAMPIYANLGEKLFTDFWLGLGVVVFYVASLLLAGTLGYAGFLSRDYLLVMFCSVYGLAIYHYYICRSAPTSFNVVILPAVMLLCFWVNLVLKAFPQHKRNAGFFAVALTGLMVFLGNQHFWNYPGILQRLSRDPIVDHAFWDKKTDFKRDAQLIARLTKPEDKVCLISSFETSLLMAADRKPFFYYFPLINSRDRDGRDFVGMYLLTIQRLEKTIGQLEQEKPETVFLEKKFVNNTMAPYYFQHYKGLTILLSYLAKNYAPVEEGEYLIALRRTVQNK